MYLTLKYEEALPSILSSRGAGNSIIIAENLTDLSSPAVFADKAMRGLSAKQVRACLCSPFVHASRDRRLALCNLPPLPHCLCQLGLLHDANGLSGRSSSSNMMVGTQLK